MSCFELRPIGTICKEGEKTLVVLDKQWAPGLKGLEEYSHVHVLWWFHQRDDAVSRSKVEAHQPHKNAPPVNGVFATRSPCRPNPIGMTTARIVEIDKEAGTIWMEGTDAIHGTPVLDLKPYSPGLDRVESPRVPDWSQGWAKSVEEAAQEKK